MGEFLANHWQPLVAGGLLAALSSGYWWPTLRSALGQVASTNAKPEAKPDDPRLAAISGLLSAGDYLASLKKPQACAAADKLLSECGRAAPEGQA